MTHFSNKVVRPGTQLTTLYCCNCPFHILLVCLYYCCASCLWGYHKIWRQWQHIYLLHTSVGAVFPWSCNIIICWRKSSCIFILMLFDQRSGLSKYADLLFMKSRFRLWAQLLSKGRKQSSFSRRIKSPSRLFSGGQSLAMATDFRQSCESQVTFLATTRVPQSLLLDGLCGAVYSQVSTARCGGRCPPSGSNCFIMHCLTMHHQNCSSSWLGNPPGTQLSSSSAFLGRKRHEIQVFYNLGKGVSH